MGGNLISVENAGADAVKLPYSDFSSTQGRVLDEHERDRMLLEHLPMVRFVARSIHERTPSHVELDELVSAGMLGLVDAVRKFEPAKQVKFKSYAQFRVRGAILDSLRSVDWSPRELRRKGRRLAETIQRLTGELGRKPEGSEVAAAMGLNLQSVQQLEGELKALEIGSLNVPRGEDTSDDEIAYVPSPATENPLFQFIEKEQRERVAGVIDGLPEKERLVLTLYYYEELTMKEVALVLGVVESRVSQIHSMALGRLRSALGVSRRPASPRQQKAC
jgi:RNA polymerase sigma factor for flagellar operon FliA